ncbi:MAG: DUF3037 domain-containing protein [Hymenobacteraceae bacterium]|nr:DUF3037 domain-containing protein [Hymenobacteraceae bacterium]MDX5397533.1 DUF3037 domain-containing protein [Hymenobacteraceae bacterium]MDX5442410.1 DUF3037 domain-containing protein [Hymenobacteraceae bacterium]MDX5513608.1 DUF3037 domain-containing protein [Hymenobacteraceae bacterium]
MQENHLFEYAVIRVVPRVEREEFLNVGVILYCSAKGFLQTLYELNEERLKAFSNDLDNKELETRLQAFKKVCAGGKDGGEIGKLPPANRFRWLTASRSTVVQTSQVHTGFCSEPQQTLDKLFNQLVK